MVGISAQLVAAAAAAVCALVLTTGDTSSARVARMSRRSGRAGPEAGAAGEPASATASSAVRRRLVAVAVAGGSLAAMLGGVIGVMLGAAAAMSGYWLLGRLEPRAVRQRHDQVARDLPTAASLLAAAVAAGATPVAAIEVVAVAVGGPLGEDLQRLAASARLGGELLPGSQRPAGGGDLMATGDPMATGAPTATGDLTAGWTASSSGADVAPLVRVIARCLHTGAPLAGALDRLAADLHAERRFQVERRARSVGVRAAAPLGLCFLPAFLLVGVVPVVAGIASTVLGFAL